MPEMHNIYPCHSLNNIRLRDIYFEYFEGGVGGGYTTDLKKSVLILFSKFERGEGKLSRKHKQIPCPPPPSPPCDFFSERSERFFFYYYPDP